MARKCSQGARIPITARFIPEYEKQLRAACKTLKCKQTDLIVAGTMAEVERRLRLAKSGTGAGPTNN